MRRTCQGVAPIARSSANSRDRSRTDRAISPPTTTSAVITATPPIDAPSPRMSGRAADTATSSASPRAGPVATVRPGAAFSRAAGETVASASTARASTWPGWPYRAAAVAVVKNAASGPDGTSPVTRYRWGDPFICNRTCPPGATPADRLRTTSSGACGARPALSR